MRTIWQRTFKVRVALNMLFCVLMFGWFGSLPRETISGFLGRTAVDFWGSRNWQYYLMRAVDALHINERGHCRRVAREEEAGWRAMYPERYRMQQAMEAAWREVLKDKDVY